MKKYLLLLIVAITFFGCEKCPEAVVNEGTKEVIEAGLSAYNVTEVVFYRTSGGSFNYISVGGMIINTQ